MNNFLKNEPFDYYEKVNDLFLDDISKKTLLSEYAKGVSFVPADVRPILHSHSVDYISFHDLVFNFKRDLNKKIFFYYYYCSKSNFEKYKHVLSLLSWKITKAFEKKYRYLGNDILEELILFDSYFSAITEIKQMAKEKLVYVCIKLISKYSEVTHRIDTEEETTLVGRIISQCCHFFRAISSNKPNSKSGRSCGSHCCLKQNDVVDFLRLMQYGLPKKLVQTKVLLFIFFRKYFGSFRVLLNVCNFQTTFTEIFCGLTSNHFMDEKTERFIGRWDFKYASNVIETRKILEVLVISKFFENKAGHIFRMLNAAQFQPLVIWPIHLFDCLDECYIQLGENFDISRKTKIVRRFEELVNLEFVIFTIYPYNVIFTIPGFVFICRKHMEHILKLYITLFKKENSEMSSKKCKIGSVVFQLLACSLFSVAVNSKNRSYHFMIEFYDVNLLWEFVNTVAFLRNTKFYNLIKKSLVRFGQRKKYLKNKKETVRSIQAPKVYGDIRWDYPASFSTLVFALLRRKYSKVNISRLNRKQFFDFIGRYLINDTSNKIYVKPEKHLFRRLFS